jgi:hypothetical protein
MGFDFLSSQGPSGWALLEAIEILFCGRSLTGFDLINLPSKTLGNP